MADAKKEALDLFLECGIDQRRAEETLKNANLTAALKDVLAQAKSVPEINMKEAVNLLYTVATTLPADAAAHRPVIVNYIASNKINKNTISFATAYLKKLGSGSLDIPTFEKECGVGVVVTLDEMKKSISELIEGKKSELLEQRYHYPLGQLFGKLRETNMRFGDQKVLKDEFDAQIKALLGEKTAADLEKPKKKEPAVKAAATPASKNNNNNDSNATNAAATEEAKELITFPDPKDNKQLKPEILEKHLKATGGVVITRFPPEPNGFLHIGHAKSMNLNFGYPKKSGGWTYLRYDDTNPEAEKMEYIVSIEEDVKWLGHSPAKITYASDYFTELHALAVELIKRGKAYVDHQTPDQIAEYREKRLNSPWRDRPIEENLKLFEDMRLGKFEEGTATLRLKMDMTSDNPVMRDLIAYRIKYTPHPHVGDKWCIYPSYDYTHCLNDSLENITHSLCTLEFERRRESYYWLIDALDMYRPLVWEYSRLNLTNLVLSKRKLIMLVNDKYVSGWDDPRLPTIRGFRRRGYTADAINDFCNRIGVTRSYNLVDFQLLEQCVREDLDTKANRAMAVLEPLKVTITNWEGEATRPIEVPNHPKDKSRGTHHVPLSNVVYIERGDFRLEDVKGYKRLAPNKAVGLTHAGVALTCTDVVKDANGHVVELKATIDWKPAKKPAGFIHWVSVSTPGTEPTSVEVRLYDKLFKSKEPGSLEDWLADLNPESLTVVKKVYVDDSIKNAKLGDSYQFERVGFFTVDSDSTPEHPVWNRIVSLKEAKWEEK